MFLTLPPVGRCWVGCVRDLFAHCWCLGLRCPCELANMYLSGEPEDYIAAAILAVNQSGE